MTNARNLPAPADFLAEDGLSPAATPRGGKTHLCRFGSTLSLVASVPLSDERERRLGSLYGLLDPEALSLLLIDIHDFKQLYGRFGHAAGDEFLERLAQILKESVRDTDLRARYGREELAMVATNTAPRGAITFAEKLRPKIAESTLIVDATTRPRRMTISIGVASHRQSRTELFASAYAALYRTQASGKNCVVAADPSEGRA